MLGPRADELPPVSGGDLGAAGGSAGSEGVSLGNFFACGFTGSNAGTGVTTGVTGEAAGRLFGVVASSLLASAGVSGVRAPSLFRGGGGGLSGGLRVSGAGVSPRAWTTIWTESSSNWQSLHLAPHCIWLQNPLW
jgi:hypothetical protein